MMKRILLGSATLLVVLYALAYLVAIDPEEQRPGTRLSGTISTAPPDFSLVPQREKVWVQTSTWYGIPHSVTTVSFRIDDAFYVPCGWCATKRWPKNVERDPQVLLKIGETLYPRTAVLIQDPDEVDALLGQLAADFNATGVYLYRMDPPAS